MTSAIKELNEDGDLEKAGIYLFMDDVTASTCKDAIEFILKQNTSPRKLKRLQLMICSNGGSKLDSLLGELENANEGECESCAI